MLVDLDQQRTAKALRSIGNTATVARVALR